MISFFFYYWSFKFSAAMAIGFKDDLLSINKKQDF